MLTLIARALDDYSRPLAVVAVCLLLSPSAPVATAGGALAVCLIVATWMMQ